MDREAVTKQMKALKAKGKAARKGDKPQVAAAFRSGMRRLVRKLKATAPHNVKKQEEAAAAPAAPKA